MIYFDSTATSKPIPEIIELYEKTINSCWFNPSSNYTLGLRSNSLFEQAKQSVCKTLKLTNHEILFPSSATMANNIAIFGICNNYRGTKKRIITTFIEHPSVYNVYKSLEKDFDVIYLKTDNDGIIDLNQLKESLNKETILVSVMWVNNIIGSVQPIGEIIEILKQYPRCKLHVDAVQAVGKIDLFNVDLNKIDLITISSHKLGGLKGTAVLAYNNKIDLASHFIGASQQKGLVPGTMDLAGAVCCAKIIDISVTNQKENDIYVSKLKNHLIDRIEELNNVQLNSNLSNKNTALYSNYIVSLFIKGKRAETVMHYLEKKDIYVSIGSACSSKQQTIDRTILSISNDKDRGISSIRVSLSVNNTIEEVDYLVDTLKEYLGGVKNV